MEKLNKATVLHFTQEFTMDDINSYMEGNNDVLYYTRTQTDKDEFHIIKSTNGGSFDITGLGTQLLKHYESINGMNKLVNGVTIKGNGNFLIMNNVSEKLSDKLKTDLNNLLIK